VLDTVIADINVRLIIHGGKLSFKFPPDVHVPSLPPTQKLQLLQKLDHISKSLTAAQMEQMNKRQAEESSPSSKRVKLEPPTSPEPTLAIPPTTPVQKRTVVQPTQQQQWSKDMEVQNNARVNAMRIRTQSIRSGDQQRIMQQLVSSGALMDKTSSMERRPIVWKNAHEAVMDLLPWHAYAYPSVALYSNVLDNKLCMDVSDTITGVDDAKAQELVARRDTINEKLAALDDRIQQQEDDADWQQLLLERLHVKSLQ
jgi:hypothetical protein